MSDVERFERGNSEYPDQTCVDSSDYDALAARLEALRGVLQLIANQTYGGTCSEEDDCYCAKCQARAVLKERP